MCSFAGRHWYVMGSNLFGELGTTNWTHGQCLTTPRPLSISATDPIATLVFGVQHSLCLTAGVLVLWIGGMGPEMHQKGRDL